MPSVAIAGGTSRGLGQSIVRGILSLAPRWKPIILSRTTSPVPSWLEPLLANNQAELRRVDYTSHSSILTALQGTHTVISVLITLDETWYPTQIALLKAAKEAGAKRFAPSEFGVGIDAVPKIDFLVGSQEVWTACAESGLEWTRYENGLFMNYLGFGADPSRRSEALSGRDHEGEWPYYVTQRRAELPVKEDGTFPYITMTAVEDIGKFVAKSLDLETWETVSYMAGDTLRMDEVVHIAEGVMGGAKWEIVPVTKEQYDEMITNCEETETSKKLWLQLGLMYTRGEGVLEPQLNRLFPDVRPLTVEGYMRRYYG